MLDAFRSVFAVDEKSRLQEQVDELELELRKLRSDNASLQAEIRRLEYQNSGLHDELNVKNEIICFIKKGDAKPVGA